MSIEIRKNSNDKEIIDFVSTVINQKLGLGKKVIWFISGGSAIAVEIEIAKKINEINAGNLVVSLMDERYGITGHENSNWKSLLSKGFEIPGASLYSVLKGKDISETTKDFMDFLKIELERADYKIGLFGVGPDGHTAGILPNSEALNSNELASFYITPQYDRITITPKTIEMLDEAVVYAMGESKWPVVEKLEENLSIQDAPVHMLKKIPLLTIFTDYKVE